MTREGGDFFLSFALRSQGVAEALEATTRVIRWSLREPQCPCYNDRTFNANSTKRIKAAAAAMMRIVGSIQVGLDLLLVLADSGGARARVSLERSDDGPGSSI